MRLGTFKLAFCHDFYPLTFKETWLLCRASNLKARRRLLTCPERR
ncbi:hypothetical protein L561_0027 [Bordetella pertussis STO1-CHOC-0019]|nr:hypothetical protein L561_0027 [Bordetella pertussis STO1-CHOC-0019]